MFSSERFLWTRGKKGFIIVSICWIAINLVSYIRFGIVTGFEAAKYIEQANLLLAEGRYQSGNFFFYSIPILVIAASKVTGGFPWMAIGLQLVVNAASLFYFYRLNFLLTKHHLASVVACVLLATMFYYQLYNVHLFTESFFFSFSILYTYLLFSISRISVRNIGLLLLGVSLLYFTRPTGVFFIPASILFLLFRFYRNKAWLITVFGGLAALVILYGLLNLALPSGGEFDFLLPYIDERIICGVPTTRQINQITVPGEKNSVEGLWYVITHHTDLFLDLAIRRLVMFFGVVRPYYSTGHNAYLILYFWLPYAVIVFRFRKLVGAFLPQSLYLFSNIFFIMITVMLSCDEWHNRFILALMPFFLLLTFVALFAKTKTAAINVP